MISKQLMAFFAGVTMVVACAGAFVLYDQKNGPEIQSDADNGSGYNKVSNDPSSGFVSYEGQVYHLKYLSISTTNGGYTTSFLITFDSVKPGILTAYVNNIQIKLNGKDNILYDSGHNALELTIKDYFSAYAGLDLLKQVQFSFKSLNVDNKISCEFALSAGIQKLRIYGDVPVGVNAVLYRGIEPYAEFELTGAGFYNYSSNITLPYYVVINGAVYNVTKLP